MLLDGRRVTLTVLEVYARRWQVPWVRAAALWVDSTFLLCPPYHGRAGVSLVSHRDLVTRSPGLQCSCRALRGDTVGLRGCDLTPSLVCMDGLGGSGGWAGGACPGRVPCPAVPLCFLAPHA